MSKGSFSLFSKVPPWKRQQNNASLDKKKQQQHIDFVLTGPSEVGVAMPYALFDMKKKQLIKNSGGAWDDLNKIWVVQSDSVKDLTIKFKSQYPEIRLNEIPELTYRALSEMKSSVEIKNKDGKIMEVVRYNQKDVLFKPEILLPFYSRLFPFQKQSVLFGVEHHGRILLGDEMGVGKTIQALALAYIYKEEWPLLIICPSSLKYNWQDEILRWYKDIRQFQIQVVKKTTFSQKDKTKIVIISYEMARKNVQIFNQFKTVIVDEAHYLKTLDSKRSETLVPFLKSRRRIILLTGTPALAKPRQIFNLLSIVRPDIYYNFKQFGGRYCDPQKSPWSNAIQYNGCKYPNQLYYMIKDRIMIRRLKKDVLKDLPPKMRQKIVIECDNKFTKEIASILSNSSSFANDVKSEEFSLEGEGTNNTFMTAYSLTAQAKIDGVKEYLKQLIQNDVKMIIFAHHRVMMDAIQELLKNSKVVFMKIDGSTSPEKRAQNVNQFQSKSIMRVALLSITAAGVGLTLTASSTVIFTELHWTPAVMFQAQDRAHRIGQPACVNCHYLVGECTIDDHIYQNLETKFNSVSLMVDGEGNKIGAKQLYKGEYGDVSKAAEAIRLMSSIKKQKDIQRLEDYWRKQQQSQSKISQISSTQKTPKNIIEQVSQSDSDSQKQLQELLKKKTQMDNHIKRLSTGESSSKKSK